MDLYFLWKGSIQELEAHLMQKPMPALPTVNEHENDTQVVQNAPICTMIFTISVTSSHIFISQFKQYSATGVRSR